MVMKKSTKEFIQRLLDRELESEFIQQNPNPLEVEYVRDLIDASKDFAKCSGNWMNVYYTNGLIEQVLTDKDLGYSGGL